MPGQSVRADPSIAKKICISRHKSTEGHPRLAFEQEKGLLDEGFGLFKPGKQRFLDEHLLAAHRFALDLKRPVYGPRGPRVQIASKKARL